MSEPTRTDIFSASSQDDPPDFADPEDRFDSDRPTLIEQLSETSGRDAGAGDDRDTIRPTIGIAAIPTDCLITYADLNPDHQDVALPSWKLNLAFMKNAAADLMHRYWAIAAVARGVNAPPIGNDLKANNALSALVQHINLLWEQLEANAGIDLKARVRSAIQGWLLVANDAVTRSESAKDIDITAHRIQMLYNYAQLSGDTVIK